MRRFKNILFFAEGVTQANAVFQRAINLAQANQARLTLVDVVESAGHFSIIASRLGTDPQQILGERRKAELERLISRYKTDDNLFYVQVLFGSAFVEVIRAVQRNGYDLVIKAAHSPRGVSERLLGSTDMHLLRKCPCPVWIDKPTSAHPYRMVLAAVDPMAQPDPGTDRLVMDLATSMTARESAQLSVVHAWQLYGESALENSWIKVSPEELAQTRDACRQAHQQRLNTLLADYGLNSQNRRVYLEKDEPASAIIRIANEVAADLVVMGTVGRTGVPGFIIGNTAEEVLQTTKASILAVKPQGFVSPIER